MGELDTRGPDTSSTADAPAPATAPGKQTKSEKRYPASGFAVPVPVKVTASALNVRRTPTSSSPENIAGRLKRGQVVTSYGRSGDWVRIDHKGETAFIHGKYVRFELPPEVAAAPGPSQAPSAPPPTTATGPSAPSSGGPAGGSAADLLNSTSDSVGDALRDIFFWLEDVQDHSDDAEHDKPIVPDGPPVSPDKPVAPVQDVKPDEPAPTNQDTPVAPKPPVVVPAGAAELGDQELAAFLANQNNPAVTAVAHALAAAEKSFASIKQSENEEIGADRDAHVAVLGELRRQVGALDGAGLDPAALPQVKARLYRALNTLAPYYSQGRNMDVLESADSTRTCNITSLAMALESLGKSAGDFQGSLKEVNTVASYSTIGAKISGGNAKHRVSGVDKLASLRMPDFLQLVAIAESGAIGSNESVISAAKEAWNNILGVWFLSKLAGKFGVGHESKGFTFDASKDKKEREKDESALASFGKKHRSDVEKLVDARNKAEASGSEKDQAAYEKMLAKEQDAMDGTSKVPIDAYRDAIISQVGAELDSGAAIVVLISGHYVRLQSLQPEHLIVDDPGRSARANRKVTWEEARAMGYFRQRLVLR